MRRPQAQGHAFLAPPRRAGTSLLRRPEPPAAPAWGGGGRGRGRGLPSGSSPGTKASAARPRPCSPGSALHGVWGARWYGPTVGRLGCSASLHRGAEERAGVERGRPAGGAGSSPPPPSPGGDAGCTAGQAGALPVWVPPRGLGRQTAPGGGLR